uniref:RING-type domain-containing protein n=1 Tax=Polytomella parva TaxID=51329 RepID=A0A6U0XD35_9CHLO|mmetsp:Transcript_31655/g.57509  ORF Transcript_31655/g.57509 Transcript_31655/m.57509 type:complete len:749 (+) Transcript_31655:211-2457(+)
MEVEYHGKYREKRPPKHFDYEQDRVEALKGFSKRLENVREGLNSLKDKKKPVSNKTSSLTTLDPTLPPSPVTTRRIKKWTVDSSVSHLDRFVWPTLCSPSSALDPDDSSPAPSLGTQAEPQISPFEDLSPDELGPRINSTKDIATSASPPPPPPFPPLSFHPPSPSPQSFSFSPSSSTRDSCTLHTYDAVNSYPPPPPLPLPDDEGDEKDNEEAPLSLENGFGSISSLLSRYTDLFSPHPPPPLSSPSQQAESAVIIRPPNYFGNSTLIKNNSSNGIHNDDSNDDSYIYRNGGSNICTSRGHRSTNSSDISNKVVSDHSIVGSITGNGNSNNNISNSTISNSIIARSPNFNDINQTRNFNQSHANDSDDLLPTLPQDAVARQTRTALARAAADATVTAVAAMADALESIARTTAISSVAIHGVRPFFPDPSPLSSLPSSSSSSSSAAAAAVVNLHIDALNQEVEAFSQRTEGRLESMLVLREHQARLVRQVSRIMSSDNTRSFESDSNSVRIIDVGNSANHINGGTTNVRHRIHNHHSHNSSNSIIRNNSNIINRNYSHNGMVINGVIDGNHHIANDHPLDNPTSAEAVSSLNPFPLGSVHSHGIRYTPISRHLAIQGASSSAPSSPSVADGAIGSAAALQTAVEYEQPRRMFSRLQVNPGVGEVASFAAEQLKGRNGDMTCQVLLDQYAVQVLNKIQEPCCICLDDMTLSTTVSMLRCGHRLHSGCLKRLCEMQGTTLRCPLCQRPA